MTAPHHHRMFVASLKIKQPNRQEQQKFEAVEITVGISVLSSFECNPLMKKRQTIVFEMSMRLKKNPC